MRPPEAQSPAPLAGGSRAKVVIGRKVNITAVVESCKVPFNSHEYEIGFSALQATQQLSAPRLALLIPPADVRRVVIGDDGERCEETATMRRRTTRIGTATERGLRRLSTQRRRQLEAAGRLHGVGRRR
jgi:hypothetical protein